MIWRGILPFRIFFHRFLYDDLCVEVTFRSPFLIDLKEIAFEKLKGKEASAAPQMIMKGKVKGDYCQMLPDLYPLMKKYEQVDEENVDYIATLDKQEEYSQIAYQII